MRIIPADDYITVNLYGGLEVYSPDEQRKGNKIKKSKVSSVKDVIQYYDIPREEVQVILIDGQHADFKSEISAGNTVSIFPLVGGG